MGLLNSLKGRLGMVGAEAQQIAKNGVPTVSSNPGEIVQTAVTVKHDVAIAGAMKDDIAGASNQIKPEQTETPTPTETTPVS